MSFLTREFENLNHTTEYNASNEIFWNQSRRLAWIYTSVIIIFYIILISIIVCTNIHRFKKKKKKICYKRYQNRDAKKDANKDFIIKDANQYCYQTRMLKNCVDQKRRIFLKKKKSLTVISVKSNQDIVKTLCTDANRSLSASSSSTSLSSFTSCSSSSLSSLHNDTDARRDATGRDAKRDATESNDNTNKIRKCAEECIPLIMINHI